MNTLAIIGGGASGLCAAIEAKLENPGIKITVFEKMQKPAKKILATGNGRCNFANRNLSPSHFHGDSYFLKKILTSPFADTENFFRSLGVLSYFEDGRIYPRSQQASTIKDALLSKIENENIEIITESPVEKICKANNRFVINGKVFDAVIVAGGGKASPVHGSDGSCYNLLENFGHKRTPVYPALCGLITNEKNLNLLKGVRAECAVSLYSSRTLLGTETGEVQFADKSVSGIPVMNLSHLCDDKKDLTLNLDLCPEISENELIEHFKQAIDNSPGTQLETILNGIVNLKLGFAIMNKAGIKPQTRANDTTNHQLHACIKILKGFEVKIKSTKGFENAQITKGGIKTNDFYPENMMSKLCDGLFACGEVLDVHGDCGGYNLHLAWTTGRIAGSGVGKYLK